MKQYLDLLSHVGGMVTLVREAIGRVDHDVLGTAREAAVSDGEGDGVANVEVENQLAGRVGRLSRWRWTIRRRGECVTAHFIEFVALGCFLDQFGYLPEAMIPVC